MDCIQIIYFFITRKRVKSEANKGYDMKTIAFLVLTLSTSLAFASGCNFYNYIRSTISKERVAYASTKQFSVVSKTDQVVTLKDSSTGKIIELKWEKTEVSEDEVGGDIITWNDILFEEGYGCGPIYRCITGQLTYLVIDSKKGLVTTFSYPQIIENQNSTHFSYVAAKPLLPVQGSLKLDVPALGPKPPTVNPDDVEKNNPNQCGYGDW